MSNDEIDELSCSDSSTTFLKAPANPHVRVLVNTALSCTWIAMQTNPADVVASLMATRFTASAIKEAKKMLWDSLDADARAKLGRRKSRRDTEGRTSSEAHCKDIVIALGKLDGMSALPVIAVNALDVHLMPKLGVQKPEENGNGAVNTETKCVMERMEAVEKLCSELKSMVADIAHQSHQSSMPLQTEHRHRMKLHGVVPRNDLQHEILKQSGQDKRYAPCPDTDKKEPSYSAMAAECGNGEWKVVGSRKKRPKVIKGTQEASGKFKGAPERQQDIFLYRVDKECDADDVKSMLNENDCTPKEIVLMSKEEAQFRSFKITVDNQMARSMLSESFPWPAGVRVRRFFPARKEKSQSKEGKQDKKKDN